jgi:sec-independent protein translocase protein TatA
MELHLIGGLGVPELLIILAVVLLLFGGSRLAGIGKSSGRAIREFKEETKTLKEQEAAKNQTPPPAGELGDGSTPTTQAPPADSVIEPKPDELR